MITTKFYNRERITKEESLLIYNKLKYHNLVINKKLTTKNQDVIKFLFYFNGIGLHRFSSELAVRPQLKHINSGDLVIFFISSNKPLLAITQIWPS